MEYALPGEWFSPVMKNFKLGCCDCHLVHTVNLRLLKDGKGVEMQFFRDSKATYYERKKAKKK